MVQRLAQSEPTHLSQIHLSSLSASARWLNHLPAVDSVRFFGGCGFSTYPARDPTLGWLSVFLFFIVFAIGLAVLWELVIPGIWWLLTGQVIADVGRYRRIRYKVIRKDIPPWRRLFSKNNVDLRLPSRDERNSSKKAESYGRIRIKTRFGSACRVCHRPIEVGQTAYWAKGKGLICEECQRK